MLIWAVSLLIVIQDQPDEARIRWLIQELGSDSFERREKASTELMVMGKQVLKEVEDAYQKAKDPAVKKTIESVQQFLGAAEKVTAERLTTTRLSFSVEEGTNIGPVLKDLMAKSKIPIELIIDDPLGTVPAAMAVKDVSLEEILNAIAKSTDLQWRIRGEKKIVFFRIEGAEAPGLPLEFYDVRALTSHLGDYRLPMDLQDPREDVAPESQPILHGDDLVQLIRDNVSKATWDEEGRSITYQNGMLVVKQTAEVQGQILKYLKKVRQDHVVQVRTEVLAIAHAPAFMSDELGKLPRVLTEGQLETIRAASADGKEALLVGSLELVGYQSQGVAGSHGTERAVVAAYDAEGKPSVTPLYDGLRLMVRPTFSDSRQNVHVDLVGMVTKTLSVERVKTDAGDVQIPKQYKSRLMTTPTVEAGKWVVLVQTGSLEGFGANRTQLLIVARFTHLGEK